MDKLNISKENQPLFEDIRTLKEVFWINPNLSSFDSIIAKLPLSLEDVLDAEERLNRFKPYLKKVFPETRDGTIESFISVVDNMKKKMERDFDNPIYGRLLIKRDDSLPIAGSIKARGGIYEVLKHAETLAIEAGLLSMDDD